MSTLPDSNLDGLAGWGSFKKKLGVNKLQTRKAVKANVKIATAWVAPTKKNVTKAAVATSQSKLASGAVLIGGAIAGPAIAAAAGTALKAGAAMSAPPAAQEEDYSYTDAGTAPETAGQAAPAAAKPATEPQKPSLLKWGAIGLLTAKAISLVI